MRVPMRGTGADQPVVAEKSRNGDGAKGLDRSALRGGQLRLTEEEPLGKAKPFRISKRVVWEAFQGVRAKKGSAGVDGESIEEFEKDLKRNLYKLWNRMSSGSYFPPPVRTVSRYSSLMPNGAAGVNTRVGLPLTSQVPATGVSSCGTPYQERMSSKVLVVTPGRVVMPRSKTPAKHVVNSRLRIVPVAVFDDPRFELDLHIFGKIDPFLWMVYFSSTLDTSIPTCEDCLDFKNRSCPGGESPVDCFLSR